MRYIFINNETNKVIADIGSEDLPLAENKALDMAHDLYKLSIVIHKEQYQKTVKLWMI